jgi:NAD(P)-dependent dehydrogenase (short-subunit alcohol dehydrogenase family)
MPENTTKKLNDKVVVITGGSRGLGLAIAQACVTEGAAVVIASRSAKSVDEAVSALKQQGARASGMAVDVGCLDEVQNLAGHALAVFGRMDVWVNNAGTAGPYGPTLDFSEEAFHQVVSTNILGAYHGSRVAMKHFVAQRAGKLINVLGHGYRGPQPNQNAYGSSKIWLRSFTMALAKETQDSGVGVFAFNPGMVLTDLLTDVEVFQGSEALLERFPMVVRALAKPPEVPARKVAWMASSATDGKTGVLVNIFSPVGALGGFLREMLPGARRHADVNIKIRVIPPAE